MFALLALILFILAGFNAHVGSIDTLNLIAFGLAALTVHFLYPVTFDRFRVR